MTTFRNLNEMPICLKDWAINELNEFLKYVSILDTDDKRCYSKSFSKLMKDWYEYIHEKLNKYDFVNGCPEENTWEKRPKAVFWFVIFSKDVQYQRPYYDHHCSSKDRKEQIINCLNDLIETISIL